MSWKNRLAASGWATTADFVDDDERVAAEAAELVVQSAVAVGGYEAVDPLRGGGEHDAVPGVASPDGQADGEVGLAGARRSAGLDGCRDKAFNGSHGIASTEDLPRLP